MQLLIPVILRGPDQRTIDHADHGIYAPNVIHVVVREHEQVDPRYPQGAQARGEWFRIRTNIDERVKVVITHDDRVTLSNIAGRDLPICRETGGAPETRADQRSGIRAEEGEQNGERPGRPARTGRSLAPQDEREGNKCQGADGDNAEHTAEPRQPTTGQNRGRLRDRSDPGRRRPRHVQEPQCDAREPRQEEAGGESDDGCHRCSGRGKQVRRHTIKRDGGTQQHENRLTGKLRCKRDRNNRGQAGRHPPAECPSKRSREQEEASRRQNRESEPIVARQPRVGNEQRDHYEQQRRHSPTGPPHARPEHDDGGHNRGTQHTRLGCHEHHETEKHHKREPDPPRPPQSQVPAKQHDRGDDNGTVRSRHRREVAEGARLHRRVELVAHGARIADGQAGKQIAAVAGQRGRRVGKLRPKAVSPGQPPRRGGYRIRLALAEE